MDRADRAIRILTINVRGLVRYKRRKLLRLEHLLKTLSPDFILLQETHFSRDYQGDQLTIDLGLSTGYHSIGPTHNRLGTSILVTSDRWKILRHTKDNNGRLVTVDITRDETYFTLVNVYSPSGSTNQDRVLFFQSLLQDLQETRHDVIMAGDFNVTLEDRDRDETGLDARNLNRNIGRAELQEIVNNLNLKDVYRMYHVQDHHTNMTHTDPDTGRGARLDRIYTQPTEQITLLQHIDETLQHGFTDHKAVYVTINAPTTTKRRSPHYKFNDTLLDDEAYVHNIHFAIDKYLNTAATPEVFEAYGLFKHIVKTISIRMSTQHKKDREYRLDQIKQLLDTHNRLNIDDTPETLALQQELETLLEYKYRGAVIRARLKLDDEEAPSKAFFSLEHNIQKSRYIQALEDEHGTLQTDNNEILTILENYYKTLFTKEQTDPQMQNHFLQYATKLTDDQQALLETPITAEHLTQALFSLDTDSAPGPDGLTYKWYRKFFPKLSPFFLRLIDECLKIEYLEDSQNLNYISLMLKDPNNPHLVKNYRPLSLNNTDYKIITKAHAIRVAQIMHIVIHPDQLASVKGRTIAEANNTIRDIITYSEDRQLHACILSIDQMKAFDRVDHSWIHRLLEHMNFGPYFRKWIRTIYAAPRACVLANGTLSNVFRITRGVRQGDPLSSYLYTISLEPFLEKIRRDKYIKGVTLPGEIERKLVSFADDLNAFLTNHRSIRRTLEISDQFGAASGSKINRAKTTALAMGTFQIMPGDEIKWVNEMRMLGIFYVANKDNPGALRNWLEVEAKIERTLALLVYKRSSIFGRASLFNTLIFPKLNYLLQTLDIPKRILKRINALTRPFIFHGTIRGIKDKTLIQPKLQGGINLQDIGTRETTYRIKYLHDLIQKPQNNPIGRYYLAITLRHHIQWDNNIPHHGLRTLPPFFSRLKAIHQQYRQHIDAFTSTKLTYNAIIEQIRPQITIKNTRSQRILIDNNIDILESFNNLHQKFITPVQKNIAYRILHSITPTTLGQAQRTGRHHLCTICNLEQETEEHIFFTCSKIIPTRILLTKELISQQNNISAHYTVNTYRAIFLNNIPTKDKEKHDTQLKIVAAYRQTLWNIRLDTRFKKKKYTQDSIKTRFRFWLDDIKT